MNEPPSRKAFNFDLIDDDLKKVYPAGPKSYKNGYRDITRFMEKRGFIHYQGSGYYSTEQMDIVDITTMLEEMVDKMPWLCDCMRDLRVSNYTQDRNLTSLVKDIGKQKERQKDIQQEKRQKKRQKSKDFDEEI